MGVVLMLLASACFTTMATLIKVLGPDIPVIQLVFLRFLLSLPILLCIISHKNKPLVVKAKKVLIIRTIFGTTAMACFYYALTHMPLAECTFIGRTQPLLLALLAPIILGEQPSRAAWGAIITGILGVGLIIKPAMAWPLAAWVALAAAASKAMAQLLIRRLNRTDHPLTIVFNFLLLGAAATSFWAIPGFVRMTYSQWFLISCVAILASIGQILMTFAYRYDQAPAVAAASYSSIVLSIGYGYFFWGEIPHPLAGLGAFFIISGGIILLKSSLRGAEAVEETN